MAVGEIYRRGNTHSSDTLLHTPSRSGLLLKAGDVELTHWFSEGHHRP
jgi:hypothetical protein